MRRSDTRKTRTTRATLLCGAPQYHSTRPRACYFHLPGMYVRACCTIHDENDYLVWNTAQQYGAAKPSSSTPLQWPVKTIGRPRRPFPCSRHIILHFFLVPWSSNRGMIYRNTQIITLLPSKIRVSTPGLTRHTPSAFSSIAWA